MNRRLMKAGEKNYLKESNGTKANCNANVTQAIESHAFTGSIIALYKMIQDDWGKIFRALRNIPNLDEIFFPK